MPAAYRAAAFRPRPPSGARETRSTRCDRTQGHSDPARAGISSPCGPARRRPPRGRTNSQRIAGSSPTPGGRAMRPADRGAETGRQNPRPGTVPPGRRRSSSTTYPAERRRTPPGGFLRGFRTRGKVGATQKASETTGHNRSLQCRRTSPRCRLGIRLARLRNSPPVSVPQPNLRGVRSVSRIPHAEHKFPYTTQAQSPAECVNENETPGCRI